MENITKARWLILLSLVISIGLFGYLFFKEFIHYPIIWIYTIPLCLYFPVVTTGLLFSTFFQTKESK